MHKLAMRYTRDGISEQKIVGKIEGYALENGRRLAYPVIFTIHGEILHNNNYKKNFYKTFNIARNIMHAILFLVLMRLLNDK